MFGLFKKKKSWLKVHPVKIWMTKAMRYQGVFQDAQSEAQQQKAVVIVAFFPKTQEELSFVLQNAGLPFSSPDWDSGGLEKGKIYFANVDEVINYRNIGKWSLQSVFFLMAEQYPIRSKEIKIEDCLRAVQAETFELGYYNSMDTKLFDLFGGERLTAMMEKMGVEKDEAITHNMISKSVERAQEKIATAIRSEQLAQSEEEWFEKNLPKGILDA